MSKKEAPPRLSFVEVALPASEGYWGRRIMIDGVLKAPSPPNAAYTTNEKESASVVPLKTMREVYQTFLDKTKDIQGDNYYCQFPSFDEGGTVPRVIRVVREPDAAYEARINATKLAKVNTLNERLAQHEAAAAAIRAEIEKVNA